MKDYDDTPDDQMESDDEPLDAIDYDEEDLRRIAESPIGKALLICKDLGDVTELLQNKGHVWGTVVKETHKGQSRVSSETTTRVILETFVNTLQDMSQPTSDEDEDSE